ncbi:aspartyl-phosphate phosphatase Spo0E family protein [Lysinibacillus piscis]|uniref:Aspartyl-phosphate phosphatase Spo0E family protein n=1 Tax=Lysinibacillus piscis TaxID=2518931 RepID=A0ABQ5NKQ8_9BACI|nr:aspartyl-phosphate phosphatase Spo0E family protein [Lysinibacillus sp. KH24]GLC88950.1 hypothetical protein LYSBPC_20770 [Lysinibacillus sp. KH24]
MLHLLYKLALKIMIEMKRKIMYKKAEHLGFTHPAVVQYSQQLDVLLNRYNKHRQPCTIKLHFK